MGDLQLIASLANPAILSFFPASTSLQEILIEIFGIDSFA